MQIGTTWLVRAGVVFLLTALAFAGSWLYYNIVPTLGPAAKLALMYLGAGALTGVGAWLERCRFAEGNESLRNYARVVLAGGLAAVYYVTYSAHWNPHLRVVHDPLRGGRVVARLDGVHGLAGGPARVGIAGHLCDPAGVLHVGDQRDQPVSRSSPTCSWRVAPCFCCGGSSGGFFRS